MEPRSCGEHAGIDLPAPVEGWTSSSQAQVPGSPCSAADGATDKHGSQMPCWACGITLQVPLVGEQKVPSPTFKCGWCGAITDMYVYQVHERKRSLLKQLMRVLTSMKWFIVTFVTLLTLSIILVGAMFVLPHSTPSTIPFLINHAITMFLSFNVFYNFFAAVLLTPGTVADCYLIPVEDGQPIPQGAFDDYRYCHACKTYKPPEVHHCSVCRMCIVDMDHHCPFINNCVGRANLRNFVLFLFWTMCAMTFCIAHTGLLLYTERKVLFDTASAAWHGSSAKYDVLLCMVLFFVRAPNHLLAALYVMAVSLGVYLGVGMLFVSQVRYIARGTNHIRSLKAASEAHQVRGLASSKSILANFQQVLGGPSFVDWIWPMWGPPPGVCKQQVKKQQ